MKKRRWIVAMLVASMVVGFASCKHEESNDSGVKVPEMVKVTGGTVEGSGSDGVFVADRKVTLSDFYIGKHEVTQEEYASVMAGQKVEVEGKVYSLDDKPSEYKGNPAEGEVQGKRPVEYVTWYDAVWYCNALSEKAGLGKAYDITVKKVFGVSIYDADVKLVEGANGYRLPTEAEWEYAARGGKQEGSDTLNSDKYAGTNKEDELGEYAWYDENSGDMTHQVGKKKENSLGLYDMTGNVYEWCWDWYDSDPKKGDTGGESPVTDPTGPETKPESGSGRVNRGGGWYGSAYGCSVSYRNYFNPSVRGPNHGFRVVRPSSK